MNKLEKLLSVTALALLSFGVYKLVPKDYKYKMDNLPKADLSNVGSAKGKTPIVRLEKDGKFTCTGIVIANNYVVTAAHCLVNKDWEYEEVEIVIVSEDQTVRVKSKSAGVNTRQDFGIVLGDFSEFSAAPIANESLGITSNDLIQCGFTGGNKKLTCYRGSPIKTDIFLVETNMFAFPGMSGGPVIDVQTNVVIGVNSRATLIQHPGASQYGPLIGLMGFFGIEN